MVNSGDAEEGKVVPMATKKMTEGWWLKQAVYFIDELRIDIGNPFRRTTWLRSYEKRFMRLVKVAGLDMSESEADNG